MKLSILYHSFYLLPAFSIEYDRYFEGGLIYVDLEVKWLRWAVAVKLYEEREGGR